VIPRLPDTPTIYELMDQYKTPDQGRRVATVILANGVFGRPTVGPPGIPGDRLKILRTAYLSALKDPALKAEAEKRGYELEPVAGEELEKLAKEVIAQPPAVIERHEKGVGRVDRNEARLKNIAWRKQLGTVRSPETSALCPENFRNGLISISIFVRFL